MQIKIISVPVVDGDIMNEELNRFLRSKKILKMEQKLVYDPRGPVWSFSIKYVEDYSPYKKRKEKVDYKVVLSEASFERFSAMREIRIKLSKEKGVPAYAIFTDKELAELAKIEKLTEAKMQEVKGVGEEKVKKYGHHFLNKSPDEKS